MPVSLDAMMAELPPERRAAIERDADALMTANHRLTGDAEIAAEPRPSAVAAVGMKVRTGQECPESGLWRVEDTPSATLPVAIHNLMPPYGDRSVTWELVRPIAA